jgi:outer membrane receptor protein involved in Fe transport
VVGLTYKIFPDMTFYTGYSEANRAPTPLELACSNPQKPCLLEGFLVSDPPLHQVVARTKEAGLRGNAKVNGGGLDWKLGLFRTDSENDIVQVASVIRAAACSRTSRPPVDRAWRQERSTKQRHGSSTSITRLSRCKPNT